MTNVNDNFLFLEEIILEQIFKHKQISNYIQLQFINYTKIRDCL